MYLKGTVEPTKMHTFEEISRGSSNIESNFMLIRVLFPQTLLLRNQTMCSGNLLSSKMQSRLLVLGLASKAKLPREAQHVLHRFMDAQSAGVMQRGAALVILTAQQGLHAAVLKSKRKK